MYINYILIAAGTYFSIRNIILLLNPEKLSAFLSKSPAGKAWIGKLGEEKVLKLAKTIFLPLGVVVSLCLLGVGAWNTYLYHFS